MAVAVLSVRELNRATLARQMLLERASGVAVAEAVERLGGMQAQEPKPPFLGLWTRLADFSADALLAAVADRAVVRATLMRSTLHLVSAWDYVALRAALQPPMAVALRVLGARAEGLDPVAVVSAARELLAGRPLTFDAIRAALQERFPDVNDRALGYAARTLVPLVMVPDRLDALGLSARLRVRAGRGVPRRAAGAGRAGGSGFALSRRVRSGERRRRGRVVGRWRHEGRARRHARPVGGVRRCARARAVRPARRAAAGCGRRRRRCGTCRSSTTSCSPTTTAPASSPTSTARS